jgi:hypothetical protein
LTGLPLKSVTLVMPSQKTANVLLPKPKPVLKVGEAPAPRAAALNQNCRSKGVPNRMGISMETARSGLPCLVNHQSYGR